MHAYDESYLDDAMDNLGSMFDYAVNDCAYDLDEFFGWFIVSGVARGFENGNPRFTAGMSGVELVAEVCLRVLGDYPSAQPTQALERSPEYWTGWVMAYYQWYRALRFEDMRRGGLHASAVPSNYILHEADITKFVEAADAIMATDANTQTNPLKRLRKLRGITQAELAETSGVALRMIQLYEQGRNDLAKASAETVLSLAHAIGCEIDDLLV